MRFKGLFSSHFDCCPLKHCHVNHFPLHIYSGVADVVAAKICFNNTVVMGGIRNNAGRGLNIVIANDPEELHAYLKTLKPGNLVLVASHMDPTPNLTDEIRDIFTALGSTMVKSLKPRDSWVFAGTYGIKKASPFEKCLQSEHAKNKPNALYKKGKTTMSVDFEAGGENEFLDLQAIGNH